MKDEILIVGSGIESTLTAKMVADIGKENVVVIGAEKLKEKNPFTQKEPFIIRNQYPTDLATIGDSKPVVCKGAHEYRLVETIKEDLGNGSIIREVWKCKCGKVLGE
jgi:hypothetical protein